MVIFSTNDYSNHGHPDPINCPKNISRKSIALYYFSNGRPKEDLNPENLKNKPILKIVQVSIMIVVSKRIFKNFLEN